MRRAKEVPIAVSYYIFAWPDVQQLRITARIAVTLVALQVKLGPVQLILPQEVAMSRYRGILYFVAVVPLLGWIMSDSPKDRTIPRGPQPGIRGRSDAMRSRLVKQEGGTKESEAAVARGLKWLSLQQAADGHFFHEGKADAEYDLAKTEAEYDLASTGLALLAFLGAGETHQANGANHPYSRNVERGLRWLVSRQGADGNLGKNAHTINTLALCEAYAMTGDAWLKGPTQKAVNFAVGRQGKMVFFRGLELLAHTTNRSARRWHTEVTAWQIAAMKSSDLAFEPFNGVHLFPIALKTSQAEKAWYEEALRTALFAGLNIPCESPPEDGFEYHPKGSPRRSAPEPAEMASSILIRICLDDNRADPSLRAGAADLLAQLQSKKSFDLKDIVFYYHGTQVMHRIGGPGWKQWNRRVRDQLVKQQDRSNGPNSGSWWPANQLSSQPASPQLGRLGFTALAILTLEDYYR